MASESTRSLLTDDKFCAPLDPGEATTFIHLHNMKYSDGFNSEIIKTHRFNLVKAPQSIVETVAMAFSSIVRTEGMLISSEWSARIS